MLVVVKRDKGEIAREAARLIAGAVRRKPNMTIGLATGGTMVDVYRELVQIVNEQSLDLSAVTTFNLDEYFGLPATHPQSFAAFMREHLFSGVRIPATNIHIPDGTMKGDYESYCASYESAIYAAGGIDLQLLGIGRNGHIGFNEPTSSIHSLTRLTVLSRETIADNQHFFAPSEDVPNYAITMGVGTILQARKIMLVATGAHKARALAKAIEGPITSTIVASALQLHQDVIFLVDEPAANELKGREYYGRVLEMTASLMPERLS